jgi:starch-binding outer membrane protein, SusD/RagB family
MRIITISIIAVTMLSACSKWLDVQPKSQVSEEELFKTEEGFEEALNGVYTRCTQSDAYGYELSTGFLEAMAQNYSITTSAVDPMGFYQTEHFNFTDANLILHKDSAWSALYNAIANDNILLSHIDGSKGLFTGNNYSLIKGEALGLRAFLHFDALRIFAPSFVTGATAKGVPYVTNFSNKVAPMSTVTQVIDSVIGDLTAAKQLLTSSDPILSAGYKVGYPTPDSSTELNGVPFLQNRRHRLNYYAVCGELARVYLYKGDKVNALANALEIINSNKFPWTKQTDFLNPDTKKVDRILYKELVFGWYASSMSPLLFERYQQAGSGVYITVAEGQSLYELGTVGADDFRYKQWLSQQSNGNGAYLQLDKYKRDPVSNLYSQMVPAIRLSEIYYIAAECTFDTDPETAWGYFNTVRLNRGIGDAITNQPSKDVFTTELLKEARKEFYGEGQIFYMYKRLNHAIVGQSGQTFGPGNNYFVLPLPDNEIEFGGR